MTRARCIHCDGVFTVGQTRLCCDRGSAAEQDRLRGALEKVRDENRRLSSENVRLRSRSHESLFDTVFGKGPA